MILTLLTGAQWKDTTCESSGKKIVASPLVVFEPKVAVERSEGQPAAPIQRPRGKKAVELRGGRIPQYLHVIWRESLTPRCV